MLSSLKKKKKNLDTQPVARRDAKLGLSSLLEKGFLFAALKFPVQFHRRFCTNPKLKTTNCFLSPLGNYLCHK